MCVCWGGGGGGSDKGRGDEAAPVGAEEDDALPAPSPRREPALRGVSSSARCPHPGSQLPSAHRGEYFGSRPSHLR